LPDYMIPSRFYLLECMPLTPSGKVDRKALERMEAVELDCGTDYEAPRDELQGLLADLWQSALRRERVGIHDHFFALGGHSLVAVTICAQLAERLNRQVPLRWLLEHPTIERLAAAIESAGNPGDHDSIAVADRSKALPMSFAQQGMWVLQQTLPDAATYNQPLAWRLTGKVSRAKIQDALQRMVERHEVLRTALIVDNGALLQRIAAATDVSLPWQEVDLQSLSPAQQADALAKCLEEDARRPFDLALAPLWRVLWIQLADDDQVLGFTFHHSIVDEWSMRLFGRELEQLGAADGCLEAAGLHELPVQYADYAVWQRERLSGEFLEQQRRYWKEQLEDPPAALVLPTDQPRPVQPSGQGGVHDFHIDGTLVSGLRELARTERTSLFTVLLAAYQVWLHRYTGATDLVVGTPVARREQAELQHLLGFFLNTLPIRMRIEGQPGFREVLRQTRSTLLEAFSHADLPFEQIVAMAGGDRSVGSHPLYQTMFVLLEDEIPAIQLDQVEARSLAVETRTSKNDLLLSIQATGGTWSLRLEYSTDLFSADCAARMAVHLTELLRGITLDADCPVGRLNLMPPAELHRVLVEWNDTARDYPRDRCIHQLFEEQVARTPDAVAVVCGEESLSYRELNARANQLARHLSAHGVSPSDVIGIQIERSLAMMVGLLGILKAGGAYWAVEEKLPEERFRAMLEDAKPRLLLVGKNSVETMAERSAGSPRGTHPGVMVILAIEDLESSAEGIGDWVSQVCAVDRAYVSYTSGSTGKPKGVVVPHRAVARLVKNTDFAKLDSEETLLHLSPLSFDASTFEIWGGLLNGGRVVMMPPGPPSLADLGMVIKEQGVTTLWLTAGLFHLLVEERLDDLKPLRQLLAGGDVLSPDAVRKARHALTGCRIINGYGPTENTTFTCCYEILDDTALTGSVPIGRPIANTRVYILDPLLQPVPIGVAGELYAGGDGLACGYLNQPRLTSERFVPDPFSPDPGAILYRTGDQCRWLENGTIEFLGRLDHQVKIRGFRVEPGEIEAVFRKHPLVRDCAVVSSGSAPGETRLVGYLTPSGTNRCSDDELRGFATPYLPSYMIPHACVWLDQLPLSPNGKLDRKRLPEPQLRCCEGNTGSGIARNLLELELTRIWERLFQRSDIGRNDSFFDLGGHSLQAVRLIGEVEKLIGRRLPIASLFQSPTIASFAQRLADSHWAPAWGGVVPLQPQGSRPPMFFIHGLGGDVFVFLELAKLLGEDQPSYGIQALGVAGESASHDSIVSMAGDYCREITSFQPFGPYHLAGYSLGGIIAYETARQLRNAGHEVALLALFDTEPLTVPRWAFYGLFVPERCLHHLARWMRAPFGEKVSYISKRWKALRFRFGWNLSKQAASDVSVRSKDIKSTPSPDFLANPVKVTLAYPIKRYPGGLDLFRADDANTRWSWFWRYMAIGGVTFHRIRGNHGQILDRDHVSSVASALAFRLGIREPGENPHAEEDRPRGDADHLP
jgi:amino acid adenylation domain-containing protein